MKAPTGRLMESRQFQNHGSMRKHVVCRIFFMCKRKTQGDYIHLSLILNTCRAEQNTPDYETFSTLPLRTAETRRFSFVDSLFVKNSKFQDSNEQRRNLR